MRARRARDRPLTLHRQLDWVAKLRLLDAYRERDGLDWSDPKLRAIDLQYHDVRREKGLYHRLDGQRKVERLTTDDEVERAVMEPPDDTRAYFRGRCISRFPDAIAAASWDSLIVDTGRGRAAAHPDARAAPGDEGPRRGAPRQRVPRTRA